MPQVVEHVVLFKVRESADPAAVSAMLFGLQSLTRLGIATHLTAGAIHASRSRPAAPFTHLLHSRYLSKLDLASYAAHPDHLAVVSDHVLPNCDDIMALDWLADLEGPEPAKPQPGSALRLALAKLKDGAAAADVIGAVATVGSEITGMTQLSCGENFSPARAKGYGVGVISVFSSLGELEGSGDVMERAKEKVQPMLESVIELDFVVPAASPEAHEAVEA